MKKKFNFMCVFGFLFISMFSFNSKVFSESNFKDVSKDSWYFESVERFKSYGIVNGSNNYFFPDSKLTREESAAFIYRTLKKFNKSDFLKEGDYSNKFSDYSDINSYFRGDVDILKYNNIINGYDNNSFKPKLFLTRADATCLISKILTHTDIKYDSSEFIDVDNKSYYFDSLLVLEKSGLIKGYSSKRFYPSNFITRAEFISILDKAFSDSLE